MKTWLSDTSAIRQEGVSAHARADRDCEIRTRLAVRLPGGVKTSDMLTRVKIEVTFGERAAGAMRGESAPDVVARETGEAARAAALAVSDVIVRDAQRVCDLRAEVEKIVAGTNPDGVSRKPWRARAIACEIRDMIDDNARTGTRLILGVEIKDVISVEAWRPVSPPEAIMITAMGDRVLAALSGGSEARALAMLTEVRDAMRTVCDGGSEVWGDPLPSDIAMMTPDTGIRNMLEQAADLRDRAAEFSSRDPEHAAEIMASARAVEQRALKALDESRDQGDINDLLDTRVALETQADMRLK